MTNLVGFAEEAPVEVPAVPVVEAQVEAPTVEAPAAEAPTVEVPAAAPTAQVPAAIAAPTVEAPAAEAPTVEVPTAAPAQDVSAPTPAASDVSEDPAAPASAPAVSDVPKNSATPASAPAVSDVPENSAAPVSDPAASDVPEDPAAHASDPAVSDVPENSAAPASAPAPSEFVAASEEPAPTQPAKPDNENPAPSEGPSATNDSSDVCATADISSSDSSTGTFSITLSNRVFEAFDHFNNTDPDTPDGGAVKFILKIAKNILQGALPASLTSWGQTELFYTHTTTLRKNAASETVSGIPSEYSIEVEVNAPETLATGSDSRSFTTSCIVDGKHKTFPSNGTLPKVYRINGEKTMTGNHEFTLVRTENTDGSPKPLLVVNDSEDPLTLSVTVTDSDYAYTPAGSDDFPTTLNKNSQQSIVIPGKSHAYLTSSGSDSTAGNTIGLILTPVGDTVDTCISSVGTYESSEKKLTVTSDTPLGDGAYALFRQEPRTPAPEIDRTNNGGSNSRESESETPGAGETESPGTGETESPGAGEPKQPEPGETIPNTPAGTPVTSGPKKTSSPKKSKTPSQSETGSPSWNNTVSNRASEEMSSAASMSAAVDTGDDSPVGLYGVLMMLSSACAGLLYAGLLSLRRRRGRKDQASR